MDKKIVLRPLYLVADKSVEFHEDDQGIPAAASCKVIDEINHKYIISLNQKRARTLYEISLLANKITYDEFCAGLMFHEVFHIKYESFSVKPKIDNDTFRFIHNVLLDSQIEHHGTLDFPDVAKYIQWILSALKRDVDFSLLKGSKEENTINKMKDTFYYLTRFGVILDDSDVDFVNFLLPLIMSTTRNNVENVMKGSEAVYEYFYAQLESPQSTEAFKQGKGKFVPMTAKDFKKVTGASSEQQAMSSALNDVLKQMTLPASPKGNNTQGFTGKLAGQGEHDIQVQEKDNEFYRMTVSKYKTNIQYIRGAFLRKINEVKRISAYDGDMNMIRQQNAYVNSFTGDVGKDYHVFKIYHPSLDYLFLRDISSSTSDIINKYAELSIAVHTAIHDIPGIRHAHIDFSSKAYVLLDFDKPIQQSRIFPRCEDATYLTHAYKLAKEMHWKNKWKIIHIITDGYIGPGHEKLEEELKRMGIRIYKWNIDPNGNPQLLQTSLERFHIDIAKHLLGFV